MSEVTIWHNPRCRKSRQALALVEGKGIAPNVVKYLETPPSAAEIAKVLDMLGIEDPRKLMRRQEAPFKELGLGDPGKSHKELIAAMAQNPILIERAVVISGGKAALGRPPEQVLSILG